tara:strand:+ start:132 stop:419 length:288 start_codon:yes stop_codon:yes gene_type:complete
MKRKDMKTQIERVIEIKNSIESKLSVINSVIGHTKVDEDIWTMYDVMLDEIEKKLKDEDHVLSFYLFDCNCGETPKYYNSHLIFDIESVIDYIKT